MSAPEGGITSAPPPVSPTTTTDSSGPTLSPAQIAIIVVVCTVVLVLVGVRWLTYRSRKRRAQQAATAQSQRYGPGRGPWSQEVQQRESQQALCYEEWLRNIRERDEQQQLHAQLEAQLQQSYEPMPPTPSQRRRASGRKGLRVTSIRTVHTAESAGDPPPAYSAEGRKSPQLRIVSGGGGGRQGAVSPAESWRRASIDELSAINTHHHYRQQQQQNEGLGLGLGINGGQEAQVPSGKVDDDKGPSVTVSSVLGGMF